MHATAAYFFSKFVLAYLVPYQELHGHIRVLDIGAYDVNGNMGNVLNIMKTDSFPSLNHTYVGLDLSAGPNVDVVATNPWEWPMLADASFDLVVSSSAFEHDALFWLTIKEMARVLKPEGLIWLSAPAAGPYHAFPRDYWRFYEDSWSALPLWEPRLRLLESGVDRAKPHNSWDDSMAVFERVPEHEVTKASLFERWQTYNLQSAL